MTILIETAQLLKDKLTLEYDTLTIERVMIGLFFTGVKLSNGAAGVSYTPVKDIPQAVCCPSSAGRIFDPFKINEMRVADVLTGLTSIEPIKVAVAIATLNALSIGAFVPILRKLKGREGNWWVIEQDPNTLKSDELKHYIPADQSEETIATADVLIVTGVTLVNHTFEGILKVARQDAEIAVIGPTASHATRCPV
ncbi:MAG: DUF364 domain-containing protein [Desulfobacterales bacterium]|jgi:uncharacterized protein (DUF4213/DUF364 family)